MGLSHSNVNRNFKPIFFFFFLNLFKELAQSHVDNDGTVNFLHQQRLKYAKNPILGHL